MASRSSRNEVFTDYGSFLHALLPQAQGFLFHDRHGQLFWQTDMPEVPQLHDHYQATLARVIQDGELAGDAARIPLTNSTAYLFRLMSDQGQVLGVLTALGDRELAGMPHKFCADVLQPAVRSMSRELSLRIRLVDVNQKLDVHGGEHEFLKSLGEKVRSSGRWETSVESILELCAEHLSLDGAMFLAPDRKLGVVVGENPADPLQAELLFESMQDLVSESGGDAVAALAARKPPNTHDRSRSWPILEEGRRLAGILVLSRPASSDHWNDHASSLASFIASTIEHVLERSFDALTGLINWPSFETALDTACGDTESEYSLMYMDIDQLNVVNDTFGRETGDEILRSFSAILTEVLDGQIITRVTSNSFAAVLKKIDLEGAEKLGLKICKALSELDYASGGQTFRPSVSIGVAPLAPGEKGVRGVLVPAQIACEAAKDRGRGRVEVYVSSDASIIQRMDDLNQVGSIRSAIEAGRLVLYAQPIVRLGRANDTANYELLVRMLSTSGEAMEPSEFLGAAERYQLMSELDRWVVSNAMEALAHKRVGTDGRNLHFAVNLSGQSLGNDQFLEFLCAELERTSAPPSRLCFEITETAAVSNLKKAQAFMNELKERGCRFALDDFGTGLSSFAYLKMFPVDKLKIDGSFVHDICTNEISRSMVTAITAIARVMDIETVAEYVQDESTLKTIRELGVNWAQGFHVGEPILLSDVLGEPRTTPEPEVEPAKFDTELVDTLPI
jgi:diguanylate cyclase (GGDEF)-like protein